MRPSVFEIGSVREIASWHLKCFEPEGWLKLGRGHIELFDRQALHQLI